MDNSTSSSGYIAALDIGSTNIKCGIINSSALTVGTARKSVEIICPKPGWVEINPDWLFDQVVEVINLAVKDANITVSEVKSLGISTNRGTFVTWKKCTGECLHNLITWQDLRTVGLVEGMNSSLTFSMLKWAAYGLYLVTGSSKFKAASQLKFSSSQVTGRLLWVLSHVEKVQQSLKNKNLMFGTLDTWLLYRLTRGRLFVTDITNASATGLYDAFVMNWSVVASFLKIPKSIFPEVVNNDYDFGETASEIFGTPVKIGCVIGDQSSAMFGSYCLNKNDLKMSMGTGAFLDVNTGDKMYPCLREMYPLVAWAIKDEVTFMLEVPCGDLGSIVNKLQGIGAIKNPNDLSNIDYEPEQSEGLFFLPLMRKTEFVGDTEDLACRFVGITSDTKTETKMQAVLIGFVYQMVASYNLLKKERSQIYDSICVDGGASKNDFMCQTLSDLTGLPVTRLTTCETSVLGVAYIAGLSVGMWKDTGEIEAFKKVERVFSPTQHEGYKQKLERNFQKWMAVVAQ